MKKPRILPAKAAFALLAVSIVVLLVLVGLVYRSHASRLAELEQQLAAKQAELSTAQTRIAAEPRLRAEYESLRSALATLEPAVATNDYVPTFLGQVEDMAIRTGNKVTGVKPDDRAAKPGPSSAEENSANAGTGPAQPAAGATPPTAAGQPTKPAAPPSPAQTALAEYDRLPIEVSMNGNFWSTVGFLREMARFPKLVAVREVSMSPENRGETCVAHPVLTVKVSLLALIHKGGDEWTSVAKK